ncbi:MAG: phytoene/squalene synthase family protein [Amaricoccus sp.]
MIAEADLAHCRAAIRQGSRSFHAASLLLPRRVRDPALALYAFCRHADDAVDDRTASPGRVDALAARLDRAYAGRPRNDPVERAFAALVGDHALPRALPDALLEGFAWDEAGRRCHSLSDLRAYAARVAASVGTMMSLLMGARDRNALARACDLGVAMQLTNVARDVGEDAAAGRLYLPLAWLDEAGLDPDAFLAAPRPDPRLAAVVHRLLAVARPLYRRGEAGAAALPVACRPGIMAASRIYAGIGRDIAAAGYDPVTRRARTSTAEKIVLVAVAAARAAAVGVVPRPAALAAPPLPETAFLVDAVATAPAPAWGGGRTGAVVSILAQLEARDRDRRLGTA